MLFGFVGLLLSGCATPGDRVDKLAQQHDFIRRVMVGSTFDHVVYFNQIPTGSADAVAFVFIDGDGRPWSADGRYPATDPTTANPVALKLMANTPLASVYVARPCYQGVHGRSCSVDTWTMARYSSVVIDSMRIVIQNAAAKIGARELVLVGYSGGGALAVLTAERLENVRAVVTIAANLDVAAWSQHHGYLPLTSSLDPAQSTQTHPWKEIHLVGGRDLVVPFATTAAYFKRRPEARVWTYNFFDHVCCWEEEWPKLWPRLVENLIK